ncbi:MAG: glycosyltransferase family 4 protein, partial [Acidimicrobiales bacterium]
MTVRVALLCPYSLSRPGGVQGQVTGLARALSSAGHKAVVLAPSERTPTDLVNFRTSEFVSLGRSVPVPANGSVAPVALNPLSMFRAVRALRECDADVLHLHEPLAPGPGYACLLAGSQPKVGTFHRSGAGVAYRMFGLPARALASRLDERCAVSPAAAATASAVVGGTYEVVGNGVDMERYESADPWP